MDIHRCRFVPYPPSAINALAFSHASTSFVEKAPASLRLAIGRANGDIEIWNPLRGAWFQETILRGAKDRSVEGLAWTQDITEDLAGHAKSVGKLRLFSIGYSTVVTEWDVTTGGPARHSTGNYGEIWCMAAQPYMDQGVLEEQMSSNPLVPGCQDIAIGCADGSIVLLSTADGDLQYKRSIARPSKKKARVLSITFQTRNIIVAGHADSSIRVYDVRNNSLIRSMSLGRGPVGGPKEIIVWSVRCTVDGTIVSGDSTGTIRFWDGNNYTQLQCIESHEADILDIAVSADGNRVFSGGMDRRTTFYRRVNRASHGGSSRWKEIAHQRLHKHDIKALSSYESKDLSIIASGGLDTTPIITPVRGFGQEHHRSLSSLPQTPCVSSAPRKRLMMTWWAREINLWHIPGSNKSIDAKFDDGNQGEKLVSRIELQGDESLTSADLSDDGGLLAAATRSRVRMFQLKRRPGNLMKVRKLDATSTTAIGGAKHVRISPDKRWLLVIRPVNEIYLYRIIDGGLRARPALHQTSIHLKRLSRATAVQNAVAGELGSYIRAVTRVAFSSDSRMLAVSDLSGFIDTWILQGYEDYTHEASNQSNTNRPSELSDDEDSEVERERRPPILFGQRWIRNPAADHLPKLPAALLVLTFRPSPATFSPLSNGHTVVHATRNNPHPHSHDLPNGDDRLFVITSEHHMYELEILSGHLSSWSRRNPTTRLPLKFRNNRERAMGAIWDISSTRERIWLYGVSWLWMFDLARDFEAPPDPSRSSAERSPPGSNEAQKRKRSSGADDLRGISNGLRPSDTGAGSRIPEAELKLGVKGALRKIKGASLSNHESVVAGPEHSTFDSSEDDANVSVVPLKPRRIDTSLPNDQERRENRIRGNGHLLTESSQGPQYWSTYMYRPILGIIPMSAGVTGGPNDMETNETSADQERLEVALVERPLDEVQLPPRYYGSQEWQEGT